LVYTNFILGFVHCHKYIPNTQIFGGVVVVVLLGIQIKDDKVGWVCTLHWRGKRCIQYFIWKT